MSNHFHVLVRVPYGQMPSDAELLRSYVDAWQVERRRKHPPKVNLLQGGQWGDMAVIQEPRNLF